MAVNEGESKAGVRTVDSGLQLTATVGSSDIDERWTPHRLPKVQCKDGLHAIVGRKQFNLQFRVELDQEFCWVIPESTNQQESTR